MGRNVRRLMGLPVLAVTMAIGGVAGSGQPARAQSLGGSGGLGMGGMGTSAGGSGMYANPYMMPMMNPYMNPYAAMYAPANPQNAALYMIAAQQSMGGIGSGQLSGSRPRPGTQAPSPIPADRRVSDTPGAGAARYFNRTSQVSGVPKGHYNRSGNYYSANGH